MLEITRGENTKIVIDKVLWKEKDWVSIQVHKKFQPKPDWIIVKSLLLFPEEFAELKKFE